MCVCRPEEDLEMLCEEFSVGECDLGYSMVQSFANGTSDCCLHEECVCDKCVIDELLPEELANTIVKSHDHTATSS